MNTRLFLLKRFGVILLASLSALTLATVLSMRSLPESLDFVYKSVTKPQVMDRHGNPLTVTYQNKWNTHNVVSLHDVPEFLRQAFVLSEDKRFFEHSGIDWWARVSALWQNMIALRKVRGASTITEQVVKMLNKRPRTMWSRWVEGFEAVSLETRFSKEELLEFYLNQVPYASQRRGIVKAARHYFNRDLNTLSQKEMLALAVLVRAPGRMDLYGRHAEQVEQPIARLAKRMVGEGALSRERVEVIQDESLKLAAPSLPVSAPQFVDYVFNQVESGSRFQSTNRLTTTLDGRLQRVGQEILDKQVANLKIRNVHNGALLVVDHVANEVIAWAGAGSDDSDAPGVLIDAVTTPRQPGSTLKPFVYAMALEKDWTASTLIDDAPLAEWVGAGLHSYHNYSRSFYGKVTVREALGNSLNIPAVKALQFVGVESFIDQLHRLGIDSLREHPNFYGDGLALGNGEVTLLELVSAYSVLARGGVNRPLSVFKRDEPLENNRVFSPEVSSIVGHILSDPDARQLEFGRASVLQLPVQTAVKTGTSTDHRDAWTVGYNYRYTVGVWMGNMDRTPMDEVTGSNGPALVMRAVFSELNRHQETQPLFFSRKLVSRDVCTDSGLLATGDCAKRNEWFVADQLPTRRAPVASASSESIRIRQPTEGLMLAMDPRIPDAMEAFEFLLDDVEEGTEVEWYLDGDILATTRSPNHVWKLKRGPHKLYANVFSNEDYTHFRTREIEFLVK